FRKSLKHLRLTGASQQCSGSSEIKGVKSLLNLFPGPGLKSGLSRFAAVTMTARLKFATQPACLFSLRNSCPQIPGVFGPINRPGGNLGGTRRELSGGRYRT